MGVTKAEAREIMRRDYIPGGKRYDDWKSLRYRRTTEDEVFRCGMQTACDVQSGSIFCGDLAEYVSMDCPDGIICMCERHGKRAGITVFSSEVDRDA